MEKLRYYFQWWQEYQLPSFVERKLPDEIFELRLIPALIGPKRSGKSTLFFQMIKKLKETVPARNILYINFEDDRLLPLTGDELSQLLNIYKQYQSIDPNFHFFLFLDEIQNVPRWEHSLRRIYETEPNVKIFITGSNSRMLSSDLATTLRGRTISYKVLPLNFKEFLAFKNKNVPEPNRLKYSTHQHELLFLFEEYLNFGGFPEVVLAQNDHIREIVLKEYIHTIFFADIVQRYGVRQVQLLDSYIKILIRQMASLFSFGKMLSGLKSIGFKTSKNTLIEYFGYIENAFLGKGVPIYSYSVKDQLQYPRKFYLIDNGLFRTTAFLKSKDRGRLLENLVFTHLFRKHDNIFYWKSINGFEVDFILPELFDSPNAYSVIQVCYDFTDEQTRKRELRSLVRACNELKQKKALIITRDIWETFNLDGLEIKVLPFIQWALEV